MNYLFLTGISSNIDPVLGYDTSIQDGVSTSLGGILVATLGVFFIIAMLVSVFMIVCTWKCYVKMGEPGWASIIPYYNTWVLCKHTWGNGWMMLTFLIPYAGAIMAMITYYKMFKGFGKSTALSVLGVIFFLPILLAICAFGDSIYNEY